MWPTIIGLFAFLFLVIIIGLLFAATILSLVVNGIIIYLVGLRSLREINKGWLQEYGIGAVVALIILILSGNPLPILWGVTTWLVLAFLIAQLVRLVKKK